MKKICVMLVCCLLITVILPVYVPASEEKNPGSSATVIRVNEAVYGTLTDKKDENWYAVTLPKTGYISLSFRHPVIASAEYYWLIYLYQDDGVTPIYGEDTCWVVCGNEDRIIPDMGLDAGTYYIRITPYSNYSEATYTLCVDFTESEVWEKEKNSTVAEASEIMVNTDYYGTICTKYDVDCYAVTLPQKGYISVRFTHSLIASTDTYWKIYMYQQDGVTPIDGVDAYWRIVGNTDRTLPEIGLEAGTYYIKIEPYSSDVCDFSVYSLRVNFTESDAWETEINGTSDQASEIVMNTNYYGTTGSGDIDWYVMELNDANQTCVSLFHDLTEGTLDGWNVSFYKEDGETEIESTRLNASGQTEASYDLGMLSKGTYYIKIFPYSENTYDGITYRLYVDGTHEHQYTNRVVTKEATCTEDGVSTETCSVCGKIKKISIKAVGHQPGEWTIVQNVSYTESGKQEQRCTVCGEVIAEKEITKLTHTAGEWEIVREASCSETGKREKRCIICGEIVDEEELARLSHIAGEWKIVKEADCTESGSREQICKVCGDVIAEEEIDSLGHTVGEWKMVKKPTCTESGSREQICIVCGEVAEVQRVAELGHTVGEWKVVQKPRCTESGKREQRCSICDEMVAEEKIAELGHTVGEWEVLQEASCTEAGKRGQKCIVCGEIVTEEKIVASGHTAGEWQVAKEASRTDSEKRERRCIVCNEIVEKEEIKKAAEPSSQELNIIVIAAGVVALIVIAVMIMIWKKRKSDTPDIEEDRIARNIR